MKFWNLCLMWQSILRPLVCNYFFVRLKQFPVSFACWLPVFDIFWTTLTNSPRNNLTGHFLPKFWHILPEISSKEIFVLKGLMNKNFFHFLFFEPNCSPLTKLLNRILTSFEVSLLSLFHYSFHHQGRLNMNISLISLAWFRLGRAQGRDEAGERALSVFSSPAGGSPLAAKGLSASC